MRRLWIIDAAWKPARQGDVTIAILSDIHHAGPAERARGEDYEFRTIANPLLRPSRAPTGI